MVSARGSRRTGSARRKSAEPGPRLVFLEDRGAVYDAPLEVLWDFMTSDDTFHPQAHKGSVRNFRSKALSELSVVLSWDEKLDGTWQRRIARMTTIRPAVRVQEDLVGPWAGSKLVFVYSPRGPRTLVDVLCYMRHAQLTEKQVKSEWRKNFSQNYREDKPWLRKFARSRSDSS